MIKLYLDTNVISDLASGQLPALTERIARYDKLLCIPYSNIQVRELLKGTKKELKARDLNYLSAISHRNLLHFTEQEVILCRSDISRVITDEKALIEEDFDLLEYMVKSPASYINPTPITKEQLDNLSSISQLYPELARATTWGEAMKYLLPYTISMLKDPDVFRHAMSSIQGTPYDNRDRANSWPPDQVLNIFDNLFNEQSEGKDFGSIVTNAMTGVLDINISYLEFHNYYLMIDMIGYHSDKKKKKGFGYENMQLDSQHAYLGLYCDVYVSNDSKAREKTGAIYSRMNPQTEVLSPVELIQYLDHNVHHHENRDLRSYFSEFTYFIQTSTSKNTNQEDGITTTTYELPYKVFGLFSYMSIASYSDSNGLSMAFWMTPNTSFFFYELRMACRQIAQLCRIEISEDQLYEWCERTDNEHNEVSSYIINGCQLVIDPPSNDDSRLTIAFNFK